MTAHRHVHRYHFLAEHMVSRRLSGRGLAAPRSLSAVRPTAWMVIVLVFASGGLALFDMYLLLSGLQ
jgi:hypothetical protein